MKMWKKAVPFLCFAVLMFGLGSSDSLRGIFAPVFQNRYALSDPQLSMIVTISYVGNLLFLSLGGKLLQPACLISSNSFAPTGLNNSILFYLSSLIWMSLLVIFITKQTDVSGMVKHPDTLHWKTDDYGVCIKKQFREYTLMAAHKLFHFLRL